jgi:hypothetical protein
MDAVSRGWTYHQVVVLDDGALVDRVPVWCISIGLLGVCIVLTSGGC